MTIETVDPATLKQWLDSGEAVLVDVREPVEYEAEHVEGAALVPLGEVERAALPDHEGRRLVIMCKLGARGHSACRKLSADIPADETVYNLEGGIQAWKSAGLPVVAAARAASSIETPQASAPSRRRGFFSRLFGANS
jgi:rhodanese-related sulfurtransferase